VATIPFFDFSSSAETAAVAARIEKSRGYVSNVMRTLGHSPQGVNHHMAYGHFLRYQTALTELQRELVICATVRKVDYAWAHHGQLLRQQGLSEAGLRSLRQGEVPGELSPENAVLCSFVFALTGGRLSQATLEQTHASFTYEQIMDMSLLSAYFTGTGMLIQGFEIPLESAETLQTERSWQSSARA